MNDIYRPDQAFLNTFSCLSTTIFFEIGVVISETFSVQSVYVWRMLNPILILCNNVYW